MGRGSKKTYVEIEIGKGGVSIALHRSASVGRRRVHLIHLAEKKRKSKKERKNMYRKFGIRIYEPLSLCFPYSSGSVFITSWFPIGSWLEFAVALFLCAGIWKPGCKASRSPSFSLSLSLSLSLSPHTHTHSLSLSPLCVFLWGRGDSRCKSVRIRLGLAGLLAL